MKSVSIIVPVWNEEDNILPLLKRIQESFYKSGLSYEVIFIDDHSTDKTITEIQHVSKIYPVFVELKKGKKGKAYSLHEGIHRSTGEIIAILDADLQYPPEAIPQMVELLQNDNADIVVANRIVQKESSRIRRFLSSSFRKMFGENLFGLKSDVQSGLKVFKKKSYENLSYEPRSGWTFDLELLHKATEAGFVIKNFDIPFTKRVHGKSKVSFITTSIEIGLNALNVRLKPVRPLHLPPSEKDSMRGAGIGYKRKKYITHSTLNQKQSALITITTKQRLTIAALLLVVLTSLILKPLPTAIVIVGILSFIYFVDTLFNFFLVMKSLHSPQEIVSTDDEIRSLDTRKLPIYSILCPLYKEAHVIPQFLASIDKLDYPKNKLDVLLLLEEDDKESIRAVEKMKLPDYVTPIVVPHSLPKTKPKACNYGLSFAKGEYLVIYDAEDMPDPLQLKKAYLGFQKVGKSVLCLQAKLNYYNPHQNLLTRFFTAEYSLWFDVTLTGLQAANTSIPLGGTSNHFRTKDLQSLEGWDPFNVTEDADLGIRLFKRGYKTAIIDSVTLEEANSNVYNWIRQRSRWIKGYMQTYLVHTRDNWSFLQKNFYHALLFHLNIGGKIAFILINPILWAATISYFVLYRYVGPTIESFYPSYIFYMALVSLVFGNFMFLYYYMIGCAKREQWSLIKYIYFIPLYWLLISWAGFVAFYQLIFRPHYWEKTVHGLYLKKEIKKLIPELVIEIEEKKSNFPIPYKLRKGILRFIASQNMYFTGIFFVFSASAANLLNFFFNAYLGRVLTFEDFATLSLVSGILAFATTVFGSIGTTVNFRSGFLIGKYGSFAGHIFWKDIRKKIFVVSIVFSILWLAATPILSQFFRVTDIWVFILFSTVIFFGFLSATNRGYISAQLLFVSLAILNIFEPLVKFTTSVVLVQLHLQRFTYSSILIGSVSIFFIGWFLIAIRKEPKKLEQIQSETYNFPFKFFIVSFISSIATVLFLTLDIVLAKHYLSPVDAGKYALISLVGKMIYFLGGLVSPFLLPIVSRNEGANKNSHKTFISILLLTFMLTFMGFIAFGVLGAYTVPLLYGRKAFAIVSMLPLYAFGMMCFTIGGVFGSYYLAKRVYTFSIMALLLGVIEFALLTSFHSNVKIFVLLMSEVWTSYLFIIVILHLNISRVKTIERNFVDFFGLFIPIKKEGKKEREKPSILIFNWRDTKHVWAGGAETYIHELAKRWVKEGSHVTIFCGNDGKSPRNQVIDEVQIIRRGGFFTVYVWGFLYYVLKFNGLFDVVLDSENGVPFFTPLYIRKPIFLLIHHVHQEVFRKHLVFPFSVLAQFLESKIMPIIYRKTTVITVSQSSKDEIIKLGLGKNNVINIIHPGVNMKFFEREKKTEYPSLLYLGRLQQYKNIDIAINSFSKITHSFPNALLTIAGFGESIYKLKKMTEKLELGDKVIFTGKVTEEQKKHLLAQSWILLQPSMIEGWGITVIEANASGTPVIASQVNGLRDSIVDFQTGRLVKLKDVAGFEKAIVELFTNEKQREILSNNAYEWAKKFSWDISARKFYLELINSTNEKYLSFGRTGVSVKI